MDEPDPRRPHQPDLHALSQQLHLRTVDLLRSVARETDLRWTVERQRREAAAAAVREAELQAQVDSIDERLAAMRLVLDACVASAGPFGLRRRRFRSLLRAAAAALPADGPAAVGHAVILAEARRLLGRGD